MIFRTLTNTDTCNTKSTSMIKPMKTHTTNQCIFKVLMTGRCHKNKLTSRSDHKMMMHQSMEKLIQLCTNSMGLEDSKENSQNVFQLSVTIDLWPQFMRNMQQKSKLTMSTLVICSAIRNKPKHSHKKLEILIKNSMHLPVINKDLKMFGITLT